MNYFGKKLKGIDIFRRTPTGLTEGSVTGGIFSLLTLIIVCILITLEFSTFYKVKTSTQITIDENQDQLLRINFNISLPELSCDLATVDVVNFLGVEQANITKTIKRYRIDQNGWESEVNEESIKHPTYQEMVPSVNSDEGIVQLLTQDTFGPFIKEHELVFIEYFAPWCHWCQVLAPVWEATAKSLLTKPYSNKVHLGKVDCTDPSTRELCIKAHVQAFPTLIIYQKDDHSHNYYRGDRTMDKFTEFIEKFLSPDFLKVTPMIIDPVSNRDGCRLVGYIDVQRAPGNFHISAHNSGYSLLQGFLNLTHLIHQLSFGPPITESDFTELPEIYQNYINTLHAHVNTQQSSNTLDYYIKIVSTNYELLDGNTIHTYQYTSTYGTSTLDNSTLPLVRFSYDLSPMSVYISEYTTPFYHFITSLFGIIGGVLIIISFINNFVDDSLRIIKKKIQVGKYN